MLKRLIRWWDERRSLKNCGCACFCPNCDAVLTVRRRVLWRDSDDLWCFRCHCGLVSRWDFDMAPVPLLIEPAPTGDSGNG